MDLAVVVASNSREVVVPPLYASITRGLAFPPAAFYCQGAISSLLRTPYAVLDRPCMKMSYERMSQGKD